MSEFEFGPLFGSLVYYCNDVVSLQCRLAAARLTTVTIGPYHRVRTAPTVPVPLNTLLRRAVIFVGTKVMLQQRSIFIDPIALITLLRIQ
jgi:hypothetical protein